MIHLYTGDGKGKTTAAIGQAIRAAGSDYRVVFAQFMKGNDSGELQMLKELSKVTIVRSPKEFGFYHTMTDAEKEELTNIHNSILDKVLLLAQDKSCEMIILDEITYPVTWKLMDIGKLKQLLMLAADGPELVLTGRDAADFLMECADYITEMRCVRHPYEKGISARKGIEY